MSYSPYIAAKDSGVSPSPPGESTIVFGVVPKPNRRALKTLDGISVLERQDSHTANGRKFRVCNARFEGGGTLAQPPPPSRMWILRDAYAGTGRS